MKWNWIRRKLGMAERPEPPGSGGMPMSASDLIARLSEFPPGSAVHYDGAGYWTPVETVVCHIDENGEGDVYLS